MAVKVEDFIMWPGIEALEYGECNDPCSVLAPRVCDATHIFVSAFFPKADEVKVKMTATGRSYAMEKYTKTGYFAAIVPAKGLPKTKAARAKLSAWELPDYKFIVKTGKTTAELVDSYKIESQIDAMDQNMFNNGLHKNLTSILGANIKEINGVSGTQFAVWAPGARAVSVVGPFNDWDVKSHPMRFLEDSGIYELFVPGIGAGEKYQFRILDFKGKEVYKTDPYGRYFDIRPEFSAIVCDEKDYKWSDDDWMKGRDKYNAHDDAMVVYGFSLEGFVKPEPLSKKTMQLDFHDYKTIADDVSEYCKEMGYTHVEILPLLEYPNDNSLGYQTTGYYAPTSRYGKPEDFKYFVDTFHKKGVGVILNWTPCYFSRDEFGLSEFDGTCLYEHLDPRQGIHPTLGTKLFNYGRKEVTNFLIGSAMYLIKEFHVDGLQVNDLGPMLYCDWGRRDGEWVGNIYGGNENLDGKEFLQLLNDTIHEEMKGVFTIGHDSMVYPGMTDPTEDGGVGFDLMWNEGWKFDFLEYMRTDPLFRKGRHNSLTLSMAYQYSSEFLLGIGYNDVTGDRGTMFNQMAGMRHQKFASLRLVYGFQLTHPGKVLNFAGTETGELDPWYLGAPLYRHREKTDLKTGILPLGWKVTDEREEHKKLADYVSFANSFYRSHNALFADDDKPSGFEWIDALDADRSSLVFLRKSKDETLLVVCNFTPVPYDKVRIGVPFAGKYREIFNSDSEEFGGFGFGNPRVKVSKKIKMNERPNSIEIRMAPMAIHIFSCEKTGK